ncbi:carboxypeptidase-like regulatory domain-containing protein [Gracilimonas sp. BCB1]|uniref:carboxypeptidase-like regulatory domain-containing protein n=1 Tax=Gracilimonas sp. BCB1 TaxID=3152362 RepID=UPI0032D8D9F2
MSTLKKISTGLFAALFGVFTIAMTAQTTSPDQEYMQVEANEDVTLIGTVVDAETENPIPEVEVEVTKLDESLETNKEGEFITEDLTTGNTYTLKIDHEGYKEYEKKVKTTKMESPSIEVIIELEPVEKE